MSTLSQTILTLINIHTIYFDYFPDKHRPFQSSIQAGIGLLYLPSCICPGTYPFSILQGL